MVRKGTNSKTRKGGFNVGRVLYLESPKKTYSFFDMIFDRKKRKETYDYYDSKYEETEDEKNIFKSTTKRRKK